jgi:hypothetical protein
MSVVCGGWQMGGPGANSFALSTVVGLLRLPKTCLPQSRAECECQGLCGTGRLHFVRRCDRLSERYPGIGRGRAGVREGEGPAGFSKLSAVLY